MSVSVTLNVSSKLVDGMTANTYPASNWEPGDELDGHAPKGSTAGSTGAISNGSVTITGLAANTLYVIGGDVGSTTYKYVKFDTLAALPSWVPPDQLPGTG